ncbi:hypothetical protein SAMN05216303_102297 [Rhodoferax sp. OV413]|uniref:hypothetical protein n=1 Tax=Rhodoferax sp. OV413 TaxID=1855285 RepID=UPI0008879C6D|nr:hypothetical protein [Rhodoferax sp. OV413]SDO76528.1 hypothetical protein SAMN05216303_102297 [Rhodoferax sp. OV413]
MPLTSDRDTQRRNGDLLSLPLSAIKVFAGGLACISTATGFATKGATATTLRGVGVFEETVDNSAGAAGAVNAPIRRDGCFRFANSSAGDLITLADVGADCYIVDDATVAKTSGSATRSIAGKVRDVDAVGVWIEFN